MYPSTVLFIFSLLKSSFSLPFTSTTTANPAVSQINDGQVQAAASAPLADKSPSSGSLSSTALRQNTSSSGSPVLTFMVSDSMGSMTAQITTISDIAIRTLSGGVKIVGLPTIDYSSQLVFFTTTVYPDNLLNPQETIATTTPMVAVASTNNQQISKDLQATRTESQTPLSTTMALDAASALIQPSRTPALDSSITGIHALFLKFTYVNTNASLDDVPNTSETEPSQPTPGFVLDTVQRSMDPRQPMTGTTIVGSPAPTVPLSPTQDKQASSNLTNSRQHKTLVTSDVPSVPADQISISPSGLYSLLSLSAGAISPLSPQNSTIAPAPMSGTPDGRVASAQPKDPMITTSDAGSLEFSMIKTSSNFPLPRATISGVSRMTSPVSDNLNAPDPSVTPTITDNHIPIGSSFSIGQLVTTQTTNAQGFVVPAAVVLTTRMDGSISADLVSVPPVTATESDPSPIDNDNDSSRLVGRRSYKLPLDH
ncbi:MAG: hypothetical protein Q9166_003962 [cf. Caloplaca sp. 2 TL-2023]